MTARLRTAPHRQRRGTAWCARLVLFAALLLGIVTMHTLGHPSEHGTAAPPGTATGHGTPSGHGTATEHSTPSGHGTATEHGTPPGHDGTTHPDAHAHTITGAGADAPPRHLTAPGHGGMDPLSVCLAVLAAWSVALLLSAAAHRRAAGRAAHPGAALARVRGRGPPPRRPPLTRLVVLRI